MILRNAWQNENLYRNHCVVCRMYITYAQPVNSVIKQLSNLDFESFTLNVNYAVFLCNVFLIVVWYYFVACMMAILVVVLDRCTAKCGELPARVCVCVTEKACGARWWHLRIDKVDICVRCRDLERLMCIVQWTHIICCELRMLIMGK